MPNSKNTMGKDGFCVLIFILLAASWWIFFTAFFAPFSTTGLYMSVLIFVVMQAILTVSAAFACYNHYRTPQIALVIVLLPQVVYYGISTRSLIGAVIGVLFVMMLYAIISCIPYLYERFRRKDPFEKLSYPQRVAFLRYILNKELKHLDVHFKTQIIPSGRLLAGTLACYCPATGVVEINKWLLMQDRPKGYELCAIVSHECQHVRQVEALLSINQNTYFSMSNEERSMARRISKEFVHYKSVSVAGFKEYQDQIIERQARAYEAKRRKYYRKHLPAMVSAFLKHQRERRVPAYERE